MTVTHDTPPRHDVHRVGTVTRHGSEPSGRLAAFLLASIEWYQDQRRGALSPCRFFPSCSEYAHDAITMHGPGRGGWLAVRRLARCRPFGPSGYDPVPERVPQSGAHEEVGNV